MPRKNDLVRELCQAIDLYEERRKVLRSMEDDDKGLVSVVDWCHDAWIMVLEKRKKIIIP